MSLTSYRPRGLEAMDANGPALLLAEHHRYLQESGRRMLASAQCDDLRALQQAFHDFELQVREHMAAEEELILPAYAVAEPAVAAEIRADHAVLRGRLERVAIAIQIHEIRLTTIRDLLEALDRHGQHEDRTMYPWAQVHLPSPDRSSLAQRMMALLRKIAARATS